MVVDLVMHRGAPGGPGFAPESDQRLKYGSSGISGEGRSSQEGEPAIAKLAQKFPEEPLFCGGIS